MMLLMLALLALPNASQCADKTIAQLPGVVLKSTFADNFGCMVAGVMVDGKEHDGTTNAAPALAKGGWRDPQRRSALALAWLNAIAESPLEKPVATLEPQGTVLIEAVYKPRPNNHPVSDDYRVALKVRFSVDGNLVYLPTTNPPASPAPTPSMR